MIKQAYSQLRNKRETLFFFLQPNLRFFNNSKKKCHIIDHKRCDLAEVKFIISYSKKTGRQIGTAEFGCVCVCERERERECVCVGVCVYVYVCGCPCACAHN